MFLASPLIANVSCLSASVTLHSGPAGSFVRTGQVMPSCRLQSNYRSTVTLHSRRVVLCPVTATPCFKLFEWNTSGYCAYQYLRYVYIMSVSVWIRNLWICPFDLHAGGMYVDVAGPFWHWSSSLRGLVMMLDALHITNQSWQHTTAQKIIDLNFLVFVLYEIVNLISISVSI